MRSLFQYLLLVCPLIAGYSQTSTENYVLSRTYKTAVTTPATSFSSSAHIEEVTYLDELGRPKQHIGVKQAGGTTFEDIVTHIEYDQFGREIKKYLPYPDATVTGGFYKTGDVVEKTRTYYYNNYTADFPGLTTATSNPFSETRFEPSPLNKPLEQGAPGKDWKINPVSEVDNTIKFDYKTNAANEVRRYTVNLSSTFQPSLANPYISSSYYYPTGVLFKTITKNENWTSGVNNTTEEFKDKQGRVVLKRTYNAGLAHDTYYVYDDFGNLTYVIPPKAEGTITSVVGNTTKLNELCYQYKYDRRNRLVEKKIPGKGTATIWESIIYNKLDQPILTQDPNLKEKNQWLFTKYDAFGRIVYTGIMTRDATRPTLQSEANASGVGQYEERDPATARTVGGKSIYYSNNAFPTTYLTEVLTVNYYDTYLPASAQAGITVPALNSLGENISTKVKGLSTVNQVGVLGTSDWITTVTAYEKKGRPVWSKTVNTYLATTDLVESDIDFMGNTLKSRTVHDKTGQPTITITNNFTYDHVNRLTKHTQTLNGITEVILENTYDKLGSLASKGVGNVATSSERLQTINYKYNVRGWLKGINDPDNLGNDLFGFKISYNTVRHYGTPLFNGNIAETEWKTQNDNVLRWYRYGYDNLNRITSATANSSNYNASGISYDKNGNITNLTRRGAINSTSTSYGNMDVLGYTYISGGNQLQAVNDTGNATYGFVNGASLTTEYIYDTNGNLTSDLNKGIQAGGIKYNHLNLPTEVKFNNSTSQVIKYTYDATGVKLKKEIPGKVTEYAGNFVYEKIGTGSNILQFFSHPEGYVSYDGGQFNYVYNYLDHLGNVRLSYTDGNGNGTIETGSTYSEIIQEKNYYPFGLTHQGYNGGGSGLGNDAAKRYGFGGKELQSENISGNILDWYDVSARNYDPALGRWMNLDPLAEQMRRHSPYNYAFDNPIFFIDPDGMSPISVSEDPIYNNKGKLIGDDGLDNGKIHIVYNKDQAKDIKSQTKAGNNAINLDGVEKVTLNGGASTVDGVVASVEAQSSDTGRYPGSSDAGLHEEGGHTEVDANGNVSTVTWEPGPKKSETGNGTINLFNGIAPREYPTSSELADYWHVHTSKTQEVEQADGTVRTYRGSMGPSGTPGSAGGDIGTAQNLENNGYNATAIQVGTSAGKKVNFYSGGGVITTMSLKNFKKLKND